MCCVIVSFQKQVDYDHQFAMSPNTAGWLEEYNRVVPSANVLIVAFSKQLGILFINIKT